MHPDVKPTLVSAEDQKGVREMKKDWTVVLAVIEIILNALGIFLAGKLHMLILGKLLYQCVIIGITVKI